MDVLAIQRTRTYNVYIYLGVCCLIKNHEKALTVEKCLSHRHLWLVLLLVRFLPGFLFLVFGFFQDGKIDIDGRMLYVVSCRGSNIYTVAIVFVTFDHCSICCLENSSKNVLLTL